MLAVLVGLITGFGAVLFHALIAFIHNLLFLGKISILSDPNQFTPPSPFGAFVIIVPVLGASSSPSS